MLVPVFNEERHLADSVAAMRNQRFNGRLEFLFADGRSTDRSREILETLQRDDDRIRIFDNPARTVTSGLNVALGHARGRWVARMDAHTVYPLDYVALGVDRLAAGDTRWVSGPQVPHGDNSVSRAVALALDSALGRGASRKWGSEHVAALNEIELDTGVFAGVWERATLLEYGGWDERWRVNEDSELAARFLSRGERLICLPGMAALYTPRQSLKGLSRQYWSYGTYRALTARHHPDSLRRSLLLPPGLVITTALAVAAPRRLRALPRAALAGYGGVLAWSGAHSFAQQHEGDSLLVPVVMAVMHYAFGSGFLRGATLYGVPVGALERIAGLVDLPASRAAPEPVFNPSLSAT